MGRRTTVIGVVVAALTIGTVCTVSAAPADVTVPAPPARPGGYTQVRERAVRVEVDGLAGDLAAGSVFLRDWTWQDAAGTSGGDPSASIQVCTPAPVRCDEGTVVDTASLEADATMTSGRVVLTVRSRTFPGGTISAAFDFVSGAPDANSAGLPYFDAPHECLPIAVPGSICFVHYFAMARVAVGRHVLELGDATFASSTLGAAMQHDGTSWSGSTAVTEGVYACRGLVWGAECHWR